MKTVRLKIVAGEASGDAHAAHLVEKLREIAPHVTIEFFGLTGEKMRARDVETVVAADDLAIIGLLEVGRALPRFRRVFQTLKQAASERKPDAVVFVDFPEFNLRLAKSLKKLGLKTIYYVSPQLWAWRSYRVRTIRRDVDLLLAILPFEKAWYAEHGFERVEFIGHPLVGEVYAKYGREEFCRKYNLKSENPIVSLLPGSRRKELTKILPPMLEAAALLFEKDPRIQFVVTAAPTRKPEEIEEIINIAREKGLNLPEKLVVVENETREALTASDAAAVASGTATLETALMGTPLVVCYKISAFNWHTLRHLISVEHVGLINLIAGERLATELIQNDLNAARLAEELEKLLEPETNRQMRRRLAEVTATLGAGGASEKAARAILRELKIEV